MLMRPAFAFTYYLRNPRDLLTSYLKKVTKEKAESGRHAVARRAKVGKRKAEKGLPAAPQVQEPATRNQD